MTTLDFTWITALKLFAGVLLVGVWLLARQQAKLDKRAARNRAATSEGDHPSAPQRIIPRSQILIVVAAILFLIVVLALGNHSTL